MSVVEIEDVGAVRRVFLNRPERRNALSGELIEGLHGALSDASGDANVRAIVIAGRGAGFCAGGDLAGGMMPEGGLLAAERQRGRYGELLAALTRASVPVIAAVHGDALGGGLGLVAAADLVVAHAGARFATPEIKVGLFPLVITAVLQRAVPRKALLEMMFLGDKVDAEHAARIGLVNRVVPGAEGANAALDAATELATRIAGHSRAVLGLGKRSFYDVADLDLDAALALLNGRLTVNLLTEDAAEGVSAFLGRRPPSWNHR
jgi:enoyl-CoA hydratase/carnithine racemase